MKIAVSKDCIYESLLDSNAWRGGLSSRPHDSCPCGNGEICVMSTPPNGDEQTNNTHGNRDSLQKERDSLERDGIRKFFYSFFGWYGLKMEMLSRCFRTKRSCITIIGCH